MGREVAALVSLGKRMLRFQSTFVNLRLDYFEGMHTDCRHKHCSSAANNLLINCLLLYYLSWNQWTATVKKQELKEN